ncbi:MAG: membrane fusion protein (multidrug efflux system), partial [Thalassolituus oleivorans]
MTSSRLATGLAVLTLLVSGCASDGEGAVPEPAPAGPTSRARVVRVETETIQPTSFEDVVQITGTIEAPDDATLSAQAGGTLEYLAPLG